MELPGFMLKSLSWCREHWGGWIKSRRTHHSSADVHRCTTGSKTLCLSYSLSSLSPQGDFGRHQAWKPRHRPRPHSRRLVFPLEAPAPFPSLNTQVTLQNLSWIRKVLGTNGNSDILSSNPGFHWWLGKSLGFSKSWFLPCLPHDNQSLIGLLERVNKNDGSKGATCVEHLQCTNVLMQLILKYYEASLIARHSLLPSYPNLSVWLALFSSSRSQLKY